MIVKVNLQSPIPTSFYITVANCENDAGMRLCKFTFTIISSLPCLYTFCHSIPTSFYIFNVFFLKSCFCAFLMLISVTVRPKPKKNISSVTRDSTRT